jgi:phage protein D
MPRAQFDQPLVPTFDVLINGAPLTASDLVYVTAISVDDSVDLPGMFTIEVSGADTLSKALPWIDDKRFSVGAAVGINFGYGNRKDLVFSGEIAGLEPEFSFDRLPGLTVRGFDRRHRLMRGRNTRTFLRQKDSAIASQIAGEAGLTAQTTDSKVTHDYIIQANQSNWDFLLSRARHIGYEIAIDDKKLIFRPVANAAGASLSLSFPETLLEFYPRLVSSGQVNNTTAQGWSVRDKKVIAGKAKTGDENSRMGGDQSGGALAKKAFGEAVDLIDALPVATQAEADQIAKGWFNRTALDLITGEGVCYGRTDLRAGQVVKLDGLGKRFSGSYYVVSVRHRITPDLGYQTQFTVRRNSS